MLKNIKSNLVGALVAILIVFSAIVYAKYEIRMDCEQSIPAVTASPAMLRT